MTFCGQARHATHERCPSHWKTLGALPEGCKGNQPVFITHLHSGSGVGAKKFRRLHLVTKIAVDIERNIDLENLHVWLLGSLAPKVSILFVLGTKCGLWNYQHMTENFQDLGPHPVSLGKVS